MVWQSHKGVLEPKPAERGVTCPPGMGLPHFSAGIDHWLSGGGGVARREHAWMQTVVVDFRGQWLGLGQLFLLWEEPGGTFSGPPPGGYRRGDRTLNRAFQGGGKSSTQGTLKRPSGSLPLLLPNALPAYSLWGPH